MYKLREISRGRYEDRGYSNEESMAHLMLQKPAEINSVLTYTYGMDDDRFPLTFLTEGQGKVGTVDVETVQWTWKTMGRLKFDDYVTYFNTANTTPGKGGALIEVHFATHWLIEQYGLTAPDGHSKVRIMRDCGPSEYGYKYLLQIKSPNPNAFIDPANFAKGKYWSMTAPTISESYSKGNRSNTIGPGKMTSQLGFHRFTKEIAGNISNVIVEYEFKTKNGTTNRWINEEMRQFDVMNRIMLEEHLWESTYNRNENGEILMLDLDNNKPIPETAGMFEICRESNYDTYGEFLTLNKLERTIGDVFSKDTDTGTMEVVLYCGKGAIQDFDLAIRNDAKSEGFVTPLGDKMIGEVGGNLTYGKYFRQYKTPDGHLVTIKHLPMLETGTRAEAAKKNGLIHPRTGLPLTSHTICCVDSSVYEGQQNVRMVRQKGQEYKIGILKGLTDIPPQWGVVPTNSISTDVDMSSYDIKMSKGLQVNNATKMFLMECSL
jgi:hypothetical protein